MGSPFCRMESLKKAILYGLLVWALPFAAALAVGPLRDSDRLLFNSITSVALVAGAVVFSTLYFRGIYRNYLREGLQVGFFWFFLCIGLNLVLFDLASLGLPFWTYLRNLVLTYAVIPTVTLGAGLTGEGRLWPGRMGFVRAAKPRAKPKVRKR